RISLDTNIVIRLFKNDPIIVKKLTSLTAIYLTVPVIAELLYGAENSAPLISEDKHFDFIEDLIIRKW
ncbi:MAG: PIN domain-containing protein, partial [Candidatus Omnitrophota bacterium]|nr:PIN domain-containing protein [Candidatus Omnitrophota bacterium]